MDHRLQELEKAAEQDPQNLDKLAALAAYLRRTNWTFRGRTWQQWLDHLLRDPQAPNVAFWLGEANPAEQLRPVWLSFLPALLEAAHDSERSSDERCRAVMALYPLARPSEGPRLLSLLDDPDTELRLAAIRVLGRCGHGDPACFEALSRMNEDRPRIRRALCESRIGAAPDLSRLEEALKTTLQEQLEAPGIDFPLDLDRAARFNSLGLKSTLLELVSGHSNSNGDIPLDALFRLRLLAEDEIVELLQSSLIQDAPLYARLLPRIAGDIPEDPALISLVLLGTRDRTWTIREASLWALRQPALALDLDVHQAIVRASFHEHELTAVLALRVGVFLWPEEDLWLEGSLKRWLAGGERSQKLKDILDFQRRWPELGRLLTQNARNRGPRLDAWAERFFPD